MQLFNKNLNLTITEYQQEVVDIMLGWGISVERIRNVFNRYWDKYMLSAQTNLTPYQLAESNKKMYVRELQQLVKLFIKSR